uniref:Uncharacterized protein n=1 Tax=viral metagenome TaxID=1070528 RepID=A0A6M3IKX4_9ZZZZ
MAFDNLAVNVTTASTEVLAANAGRAYALLINDSDTVVYLAIGEAAVANSGIRLAATGGSFEMSRACNNLTGNAVYGIHGGSGNKVICGIEA